MTGKKAQSPIAIVGYGHRLPGGLNTDEAFYDLLKNREFVQEDIEVRYGPGETPWDPNVVNGPNRVASPFEGLILDGKELTFDCAAFGVSVAEAKRMDPQIKMILTCTWEALQSAGMDQKDYHNSNTGVFIGQQVSAAMTWRPPMGTTSNDVPGKSASMIANRVSYHFNWMGPSYAVATACSSGITALDSAVKALDCGECDMAAFGAVQYLGAIGGSLGFNAMGIISKTGTSRSFDKDANGYMRSEGAFVYILKRLEDAERDGDRIFGVIRGVGLNAAGAEPGAAPLTQGRMILAPVGHAQEVLMKEVSARCGIKPEDVDYVEAHATGTVVGDMNEGNAIANAYGSSTRETFLRVASSRSNLGHMEAASFTLSLLKAMLMFKHRTFLPVSSHFKSPNPKIPFDAKRMRVQTEAEPFPDREAPVTVGINSFGFGGANGHCLLQEYKDTRAWSKVPGDLEGKVFTIPVTAKSEEALIENVRRLSSKLEELEAEVSLYDLAANLTERMTHFRYRSAFVASTYEQLKEKLEGFLASAEKEELAKDKLVESLSEASANDTDPVAIVFPGQGSQWAGCGKELYETEIVFRRVVDAIDAEWMKLAGCKLSEVAFDPEVGDKINECGWAQPVSFMVQVAMYEMLRVQGVRACCVIGHSAGEAGAAYASGAYTLEEACYVVYHRATLQQKLAGCGRMFVLMMEKGEVEKLLEEKEVSDKTYIACTNAPANTVVCGSSEVIEELKEKLSADGINGKLIPGNIAFHSPLMLPIQEELMEVLGKLDGETKRTSKIPYVSTVTGAVFNDFDAKYWWDNVRQPVNYLDGMKTIHNRFKPKFFIELAPHITLRSPTRDCYAEFGEPMPPYVYSLVRKSNTAEAFADFLGRCFKAGLPIDYTNVFPLPKPITHSLPKYFLKEEKVIDPLMDDHALEPAGPHLHGPMLGRRSQADRLQFEAIYSLEHYGWVADHVVQGSPIIPAAGYIELLLEAFRGSPLKFISARFLSPFILSAQNYYIHTVITPVEHTANRFEFRIVSREHSFSAESTLHCTGVVEKLSSEIPLRAVPSSVPHTLAAVDTQNFTEHLYDGPDYYDTTVARLDGFNYGPLFQALQVMHKDVNSERIMAHMAMDETRWEHSEKMGFVLHPCLLDGALQIFIKFFLDTPDFTGIPQMLNDLVVVQKPTGGQITCIFEPPAESPAIYEKGQFLGPGLGERAVGSIAMYDTVTGELVAYLGSYKTYNSNTRKGDRINLNHSLSWQPKDDLSLSKLGVSEVKKFCEEKTVAEAVLLLINDINQKSHPESEGKVPYFLNAGECVIGEAPAATFMEYVAGKLSVSPVQYTLCGNDTEYLRSIYDKVGASSLEANLRFASTEAEDFESGMIRKHMFELLSVRCASEWNEENEEELKRVTQLVAPCGLMLVETPAEVEFVPEKFTALWSTDVTVEEVTTKITLLQAPALEKAAAQEFTPETSCIVDDSMGFSSHWRELNNIEVAGESKETDFKTARDWENVFYFALDGSEELSYESAELTEWVKKFSYQRNGVEGIPHCLFTVFTTGGARVVSKPTQSSIWGAVRSIAMEIGDSCNVDFRIIDLESKEDLSYVLSIQDMREREMCIHNGKVWSPRLVSRKEFQSMVTMDDGPLVRQLTLEVLELLAEEKVPTLPITKYPYGAYHDALRIMMKGEHQGKMVLTPPKGEDKLKVVDNRPIYGKNEKGEDTTIFITGGFGGFGLLLLRYLISMGARNIMMVDRDETLRRDAAWLHKVGKLADVLEEGETVRLETVYANMPVEEEVVNAVAEVAKRGMPPIASVFHLAGILDDKMLTDLDRESFKKVFKPKVDGALFLHNATKDIKTIEHFVMFSSISALMGNAGQINYAAANSYLDGLAQKRRAEGLPALAFNLGAVSVAGMAARNPQLLRMMKANGTPAISGVFAIDAIDFALRSCPYSNTLAALTSGIFPANLDSSDFLRAQAQLVHNGSAFKLGRSSAFSKVGIASLLAIKVADLCGVEEVDPTEPFATYGLNSISVAELLAFIKNEMSFTGVGAIELMTTASCESIAEKIVAAQEDKGGDGDEDGEGDDENAGEEEEEVEVVDLPLEASRFMPKIEEFFPEGRKIVLPVKKSSTQKPEVFTPSVPVAQSSELEEMISSLPHIVRETVDELTGFVAGLATDGAKAVPVEDIRKVVLTGATGFCGRHFIADLLNNSPIPIELIYCPVRAASDEEALARVIKSMEEAGTWDESFKDRLCVFAADLSEKSFGNPEKFEEVCESADACYHFAASISLSASYNAIREINCAPMREVFRMCAEKKKKHFWLASTLGIFPQYFCMFSDDMADKPISRNAMPDVQLMKRVFPISLAGYPWSKLVNEIVSMEFARVVDVPYALFRLPLMCMNSDTGYTVANDPFVRLLVAVMQTGMTPSTTAGLPSADCAFANRAMLKLSMNPARKNNIYHCYDVLPAPMTKAPALSMLGFGAKNVQYHEFKEACQSFGSASPLKDYWLLLDLFSSYWFDFKKRPDVPLIDTSCLQEDSDMTTEDIDALGTLESGLKWCNANKDLWPFPTQLGYSLTVEKILQPAHELCEKYGISFEAAIPNQVVESITRLLDEIVVAPNKVPSLALYMTAKLEDRIHFYRLLQEHPEIKDEPINKPVFILGLNRTGSTFLHRLMVSSGNFEAPFLEDQIFVPPAEELNGEKYSKESRDSYTRDFYREYFKLAEGVHDFDLGVPEEDMTAHAHAFMTFEYDVGHKLPKYREWLQSQPFDDVYAEHKTWMQYIAWSRKKQGLKVADRWCFKLPWHARFLPSLMKTYPDAQILHTHRDLKQVTASWCALVSDIRAVINEYHVDRSTVGPEQLVVLRETLEASSTFRKENEQFADRFHDVQFDELVASPLEVASAALTHVGIEPDMDMMTELGEFLQVAAEKRDAMAKKSYDLKDYGLEDKDF